MLKHEPMRWFMLRRIIFGCVFLASCTEGGCDDGHQGGGSEGGGGTDLFNVVVTQKAAAGIAGGSSSNALSLGRDEDESASGAIMTCAQQKEGQGAAVEGLCVTPVDVKGWAQQINLVEYFWLADEDMVADNMGGGCGPARLLQFEVFSGESNGLGRSGMVLDLSDPEAKGGESNLEDECYADRLWHGFALDFSYLDVKFPMQDKVWTARFIFEANSLANESVFNEPACIGPFEQDGASWDWNSYNYLPESVQVHRADLLLCRKATESEDCAATDFEWLDLETDTFVSSRPSNPLQIDPFSDLTSATKAQNDDGSYNDIWCNHECDFVGGEPYCGFESSHFVMSFLLPEEEFFKLSAELITDQDSRHPGSLEDLVSEEEHEGEEPEDAGGGSENNPPSEETGSPPIKWYTYENSTGQVSEGYAMDINLQIDLQNFLFIPGATPEEGGGLSIEQLESLSDADIISLLTIRKSLYGGDPLNIYGAGESDHELQGAGIEISFEECEYSGEEICDGVDNDCDWGIDEGNVCCVAAAEVCDGVDNDCDGSIDEGLNCPVYDSQVSCGDQHSCYLDESSGAITCWGLHISGQTSTSALTGKYIQIDSGGDFNCALSETYEITCWGDDDNGQVSDAPAGAFMQVDVGWSHACATDFAGEVKCWGANGSTQSAPITAVPTGEKYVMVSAGSTHTCALTDAGRAVCWGDNSYSQTLDTPDDTGIKWLAAGGNHTCAIKSDDTLICWGDNSDDKVEGKPGGTVEFLASGDYNSCAIDSTTHETTCWGLNTWDLLSTVPTAAFEHLCVGAMHACGLSATGDIECWGGENWGQISGAP
jgi:hypothetical protein